MNHKKQTNNGLDYRKWAGSRRGMSAAAKVLVIMIASLLLLSLRASITRAEDPPDKPVIYLPVVAQPSKPLPTDWEQAIKEIVNRAAKLAPLAEDRNDIETESLEPTGDDYRYTYEKHDVVDNITEVLYLGLNDDVIWPGSLVRGDTAHDFVYNPILLPRAPIMLSLNLETSTTGDSISQEVIDPKLSTVRQGISDLLKKAVVEDTTVPAETDFVRKQVYSESQMNLIAEANIGYGAGSLDTRFDWDSSTKKNKIMVRYRQIYFSVDIDPPATPAVLFDPSRTSVSEIEAALPAGSMPMYVSGVKYGMMALMFIETDFTEDQMKLALDAAYGKGDLEADLGFGYSTKDVMQQSNVQIVVYGGSVEGLDEFEGYESFKNVMFASRNFTSDSPGVPLVYKFRHLKDNTLGLITLTSQYTIVTPLQIQQRIRITAHKFVCKDADDEGLDNTIEMDRFKVSANGYNRTDSNDSGVLVNIPDHPTEGTTIYYWETPEWQAMKIGHIHEANSSIDMTFDTKNYDFEQAKLSVFGYAREWDTNDDNYEEGEAWVHRTGSQMFSLTKFSLYSADFEFDVMISIEPLKSPPSPPPSPFAGTRVSFESYNEPNHYLYDDNFKIKFKKSDETPAFARYATFKKKPGLRDPGDDELVSFESVANPGHYLKRSLYTEWPSLICCKLTVEEYEATTQFVTEATFRMVPGLAGKDDNLVSLMTYSDLPNYYLYHRNGEVFLHPYDPNDQNFAADATFKEVPGLAD